MESKSKKKKYSEQPRDLQNIVGIMQKMGIEKFENNVPHMLMEFAHTYTQELLDDARAFSDYAQKSKKLETTDIQ